MGKKTIAVDIDDVLSIGAQGFVNFSNKRWGTNLTIEDYDERWALMWGVDHSEEIKRAHKIYRSGLVGTFSTHKKAKEVLEDLAKDYRLVIVTSRVKHVQKDTLDWVNKNFPGLFTDIHFAGFYDDLKEESHKHTKADLLKEIGADYLIDDHPKHCLAAAEAGITSLLYGDYAWNRNLKKLPKNVIKVADWAEIKKYFDEIGR